MLQTTAVALLLGFWASLYLLDSFLKTHRPVSSSYLTWMNQNGLSISIAQLRWYTTYFNRTFLRLGTSNSHFLKIWFTLGILFGMIAMIVSVILLMLIVVNTLSQHPVEQQVLTPVMPGVNLPMNQIVYYLLTLFVCGIFHEFGHAIAAVREQVRVNGFGLFILALYPGAFVDLFSDQLQVISPLRQLRIYCAGVWHNFVIVVSAIAVLLLLPMILAPFYKTGDSIVITSVLQNSPVSGPRGMVIGDEVTSIDSCRVTSISDWTVCMRLSLEQPNSGYCLPLDLIKQQDVASISYKTESGNVECCANVTSTHLCFSYHTKKNTQMSYACLPARTTTERPSCRLHSDCHNPHIASVCTIPSLDNTTRLLRVFYASKQPLLFLGPPLDLYYLVTISDYVPKLSIIPLNIPYILETFCKYLISLSGALAILNVVPCYALDGQWILLAFIELTLASFIKNSETRSLIYTPILLFGTALLSINIIIALWVLFVR